MDGWMDGWMDGGEKKKGAGSFERREDELGRRMCHATEWNGFGVLRCTKGQTVVSSFMAAGQQAGRQAGRQAGAGRKGKQKKKKTPNKLTTGTKRSGWGSKTKQITHHCVEAVRNS